MTERSANKDTASQFRSKRVSEIVTPEQAEMRKNTHTHTHTHIDIHSATSVAAHGWG